jgi:hypothetical protein
MEPVLIIKSSFYGTKVHTLLSGAAECRFSTPLFNDLGTGTAIAYTFS